MPRDHPAPSIGRGLSRLIFEIDSIQACEGVKDGGQQSLRAGHTQRALYPLAIESERGNGARSG